MENFGIKVSKEYRDVKNPTLYMPPQFYGGEGVHIPIYSRSLFTMNSANFFLKTYVTGSATVTVPANSIGFGYVSTDVSHNLGYIPFVNAWWSLDNATFFPMFDRSPSYSQTSNKYAQIYPATNTLNLSTGIFANTSAYTVYWRYVIYVDSL